MIHGYHRSVSVVSKSIYRLTGHSYYNLVTYNKASQPIKAQAATEWQRKPQPILMRKWYLCNVIRQSDAAKLWVFVRSEPSYASLQHSYSLGSHGFHRRMLKLHDQHCNSLTFTCWLVSNQWAAFCWTFCQAIPGLLNKNCQTLPPSLANVIIGVNWER